MPPSERPAPPRPALPRPALLRPAPPCLALDGGGSSTGASPRDGRPARVCSAGRAVPAASPACPAAPRPPRPAHCASPPPPPCAVGIPSWVGGASSRSGSPRGDGGAELATPFASLARADFELEGGRPAFYLGAHPARPAAAPAAEPAPPPCLGRARAGRSAVASAIGLPSAWARITRAPRRAWLAAPPAARPACLPALPGPRFARRHSRLAGGCLAAAACLGACRVAVPHPPPRRRAGVVQRPTPTPSAHATPPLRTPLLSPGVSPSASTADLSGVLTPPEQVRGARQGSCRRSAPPLRRARASSCACPAAAGVGACGLLRPRAATRIRSPADRSRTRRPAPRPRRRSTARPRRRCRPAPSCPCAPHNCPRSSWGR